MARRETTAQPQRGTCREASSIRPTVAPLVGGSHGGRQWFAGEHEPDGHADCPAPDHDVFGLNLDQAQWVVIAYVITGAMLVPAVGWLGNRLGNRTLYLLALSVFVTGSALCGPGLEWTVSHLPSG